MNQNGITGNFWLDQTAAAEVNESNYESSPAWQAIEPVEFGNVAPDRVTEALQAIAENFPTLDPMVAGEVAEALVYQSMDFPDSKWFYTTATERTKEILKLIHTTVVLDPFELEELASRLLEFVAHCELCESPA